MSLPLPAADLLALARQAGEAIMAIYASEFTISDKPDNSPVTEADYAVDRVLRESLPADGEGRVVVLATDGENLQGEPAAAAEALGLERSHLYKKIKALGIERPER